MSQQHKITAQLRSMILNGEFAPGDRIAEIPLAKELGVSRTPIRHALGILEQEGLVSSEPNRGFRVESFSVGDIIDAINLRGTLEGMAARLVAEHGLTRRVSAKLSDCIEAGEQIVVKQSFGQDDLVDYAEMNARFHSTISAAAENRALDSALKLNNKLPFVAPGVIALRDPKAAQLIYSVGHAQHQAIFDALQNGEGARVEALMREHALLSRRALDLFKQEHESDGQETVPGLALVRA